MNHYYEPQFIFSRSFDPAAKRALHLDFNVEGQLAFLQLLQHKEELLSLAENLDGLVSEGGLENNSNVATAKFYLNNPAFGRGDADLYYLLIRNLKPKRIIEIGSGHSTKLALQAIQKNTSEGHLVSMTCIEPYECNWLEQIEGIELIRKKVEELDPAFFEVLEPNDILFIDSSHIIRPDNDVLFEYLQVLPRIKPGVWIHVHDIFTPRNYPKVWLQDELKFWNEQYLLEAFLSNNKDFQITCSLNYLTKDYYEQTAAVLLNLNTTANPGSFWMKRI
ncbi:class I SAM-dependent methyltransferase [Sediminibacterium salmoneum]|uniref:class I SAM-dependent methyltransferase n=1 Tax=Sediminibacterium salmoneum TaxID=426421 RepID=UPI00155AE732|nr:class I SAM-dependent methyltransferase [Sediminibacterium salmoneum]